MTIRMLSRDAKPLRVAERGATCHAAVLDERGGWDGAFDNRRASKTRSDANARRWPVCGEHAAAHHVWAGEL